LAVYDVAVKCVERRQLCVVDGAKPVKAPVPELAARMRNEVTNEASNNQTNNK
jgi:hypothetical protein